MNSLLCICITGRTAWPQWGIVSFTWYGCGPAATGDWPSPPWRATKEPDPRPQHLWTQPRGRHGLEQLGFNAGPQRRQHNGKHVQQPHGQSTPGLSQWLWAYSYGLLPVWAPGTFGLGGTVGRVRPVWTAEASLSTGSALGPGWPQHPPEARLRPGELGCGGCAVHPAILANLWKLKPSTKYCARVYWFMTH